MLFSARFATRMNISHDSGNDSCIPESKLWRANKRSLSTLLYLNSSEVLKTELRNHLDFLGEEPPLIRLCKFTLSVRQRGKIDNVITNFVITKKKKR